MNKFGSVAKPLNWFISLLTVAFMAGCGNSILGGDSVNAGSTQRSSKAITAYSLSGVAGIISESAKTIVVTLPNGTAVTSLAATFTSTGKGVPTVAAVNQISGTTLNNFTSPVAYVVTALDASTATYTVTVIVASATANAITTYSINGVDGTINETAKTIAVTLPAGTALTGLIGTFTTSGASVKVGTTAQTSGTTPNDFTTPVIYTVTAADASTSTYTVKVTVASVTAKAITAYSLAGVAGTINESAKTIAVTLPAGTAVTSLIATFTSTGKGSPTVVGVKQISGTTSNNFSSPVAYIVTAADATTATYTVTVTVAGTSSKAITAYSLNGITGVITEPAHTILVTLPTGTAVTSLIATFTSTGKGVPTVAGVNQFSSVTSNDFTTPKDYLVTAADASTVTYTVTVVVSTVANPTAPALGEAGRFLILASQTITNVPTSALSNGDLGIMDQARSYYAGFTPGVSYGQFTELTGGMSYASDDLCPAPYACPLHYSTPVVGATWTSAGTMITQVRTDLTTAYNFLAAGTNPTSPVTTLASPELGGLTLVRGVYSSAVDLLISTPLHLDAQGDPNAVFIITTNGKITNGVTGNIVLDNGAQARNIYWRSAGITTIAAGTTFYGNVFAFSQVNVLAGAIITGSLFAVTDQVTLISDAVTKAP